MYFWKNLSIVIIVRFNVEILNTETNNYYTLLAKKDQPHHSKLLEILFFIWKTELLSKFSHRDFFGDS